MDHADALRCEFQQVREAWESRSLGNSICRPRQASSSGAVVVRSMPCLGARETDRYLWLVSHEQTPSDPNGFAQRGAEETLNVVFGPSKHRQAEGGRGSCIGRLHPRNCVKLIIILDRQRASLTDTTLPDSLPLFLSTLATTRTSSSSDSAPHDPRTLALYKTTTHPHIELLVTPWRSQRRRWRQRLAARAARRTWDRARASPCDPCAD